MFQIREVINVWVGGNVITVLYNDLVHALKFPIVPYDNYAQIPCVNKHCVFIILCHIISSNIFNNTKQYKSGILL